MRITIQFIFVLFFLVLMAIWELFLALISKNPPVHQSPTLAQKRAANKQGRANAEDWIDSLD